MDPSLQGSSGPLPRLGSPSALPGARSPNPPPSGGTESEAPEFTKASGTIFDIFGLAIREAG